MVDDGSRDDTWPQLRQLAANRDDMRLVQHPHNRGVAAAIATGIASADAPRVASIDGDLSYDPRELRPMLALLAAHSADVVTASPYRRDAVVGLPLHHEGFLGTVELLVRVLRRGGVVVEHPCVLEARQLGFSKMKVSRAVFGHLRLLWQVAIARVP